MRIMTQNLKPVQRIWTQLRIRGVPYYEYVLLDFANKTLGFMNDLATVKVNLNLEDNDGKGLEHRNMFVDGSKFFSLVSFYSYIDLDGDTFYSPSGDKFLLTELKEDISLPDQEYNDWEEHIINFTPELNKQLTLATLYVDSDTQSDFSTLFIHEGSLIACNPYRMFFGDTKADFGQAEFNIPYNLLKLITSLGMSGEVSLLTRSAASGTSWVQISYKDIWLRFGCSTRFSLPFDPEDQDFISTYKHDTTFKIHTLYLDSAVKFLSQYFNEIPNAICHCCFETANPSNKSLVIHLQYESGTTDYRVPIEETSNDLFFDGQSFFMFLSSIKSALGILTQYGTDLIEISFDPEAPAMSFSASSSELDCPIFVVHVTTEEVK